MHDLRSLIAQNAAYEEAPVAIAGIFFAAHESDATMIFKEAPQDCDTLLEILRLRHFPVQDLAILTVEGRVCRATAEQIADVGVAYGLKRDRVPQAVLVELRRLPGERRRAQVDECVYTMVREQPQERFHVMRRMPNGEEGNAFEGSRSHVRILTAGREACRAICHIS